MNELFKEPENNIYFKACDCRVTMDTPVVMKLSLDPRYWVGECKFCSKIYAEKTRSKYEPKIKTRTKKQRGDSRFAKSEGYFEGKESS